LLRTSAKKANRDNDILYKIFILKKKNFWPNDERIIQIGLYDIIKVFVRNKTGHF